MKKRTWEEAEKRREEETRPERRKSQKKEDVGAGKGRKVAEHCVFPMICGSGGSKSRLAKAAGAEPSGQMRDEHLHAVVARSIFGSKHVQTTPFSEHSWKLRCRKSARRCGAKQISKSKRTRHTNVGAFLEVAMSKRCTLLWREAHFEVKIYKAHHSRSTFGSWNVEKVCVVVARRTFPSQHVKNTTCSDHFWTFRCHFAWQAQGILHPAKSEQTVQVLWHFQNRWQAWDIWRGSPKMDYKRHVHQRCYSTSWYPERGCILEHQIFRFAKMILPDRCSTSHDPASLFRGRRSTLHRWSRKIAKRIGTRPSALHSTFYFWRTSRRTASFLMLSSWKAVDVSQNCYVFGVVNFENGGNLAE